MSISIKEVTSEKDLRSFIRFQHTLYRDNPYWAPPLFFDEMNTLHWKKNPAFEKSKARYWLAYRDGKIVGRIAAILSYPHIEKWQQRYMRFGWIDFVDDPEVSQRLLETVEAWAKENHLSAVHGPLGFSDMDHEGTLVEGFDELGTLAGIYNYSYYPTHLEKMGYIKDTDWVEYEIKVPTQADERIAKLSEIVLRRNNLKLLQVTNKKGILPYAHELFDVLQEAYEPLYGFVPLTPKQVDSYIDQYFGFIKPEFVPIVLDEQNHVVAFGITMPSLTRALQKARGRLFPFGFIHLLRALSKNDRADLYLVGVKPEYQGKGINAILIQKMVEEFNRLGVTQVESNPELENNTLVQAQWKSFEKRQHKRRRVYIKHLA